MPLAADKLSIKGSILLSTTRPRGLGGFGKRLFKSHLYRILN
jgi:hypothetical protein